MLQLSSLTDLPSNIPASSVLVPTMGALHEGHAALIRAAREIAGASGSVVVSIFLNPLQFDRPGDLADYPASLEEDLALCRSLDVNVVFTPSPAEFYATDHSVRVSENLLSRNLCGAARPGHFEGVCTVVLKLFHALLPSAAVFGKKDYQQLAIIRRLVRDLFLPIEIHDIETVRDPDGLALSSRNLTLNQEHRADAPRIHRALLAARDLRETGEQRSEVYLKAARHHLLHDAPAGLQIDYLELVDRENLQLLPKVAGPALLAAAVYYDDVRLIDNVEI
ncbi:MAG: pantoate--beta-alanine ligase [Verrucomicrobiaceae bacterium]|jgi:pantoate--beta-alanine ligase|nr:pantoate--beta-alanine ligase [Verrucomicrobiaceae bacterium]